MKTEVDLVDYILNNGIPVLVYNGQDDLIVQNAGTMRWVDKLAYASTLRKEYFTPWKIDDKMVGVHKMTGLLELRIVFNAGHLVPMDAPIAALDMATSFVKRVTA